MIWLIVRKISGYHPSLLSQRTLEARATLPNRLALDLVQRPASLCAGVEAPHDRRLVQLEGLCIVKANWKVPQPLTLNVKKGSQANCDLEPDLVL